MSGSLTLAFRNIVRNSRRSLATVVAIGVGALAVMVAGGFIASIHQGLTATTVRQDGHLHVYPKGYLEYGASRPTEYFIGNPHRIVDLIHEKADLAEAVRVATPVLRLAGIAGNFSADASKTFLGIGVRPSEQNAMRQWNPAAGLDPMATLPLADHDVEGAVVGVGLARMLNLCGALAVPDCHDQPIRGPQGATAADPRMQDLAGLAAADLAAASAVADARPRIDLLAASGEGAPNVVSLHLNEAVRQAQSQIDDSYVAMHLEQAQRLLHGGADRATAVVVQLHEGVDPAPVQRRLGQVLAEAGLDVEVRSLDEFHPTFARIIAMFSAIFVFLAVVIGLVVLFTVVNTMTMTVMGRVDEIGTLRALGLRRGGIRRLFLAEGALLGVMGATVGLVLALAVAGLINAAGLSWTPPSNAYPQPLRILLTGNPAVLALPWLAMALVATLSALLPANRAARMTIVDAIRHV